MNAIIASPGRTLILPDDIGSIYNTSLNFPNKPQMATLDFSLDISAILAGDDAICAAALVEAFGPDDQLIPMVVEQQPRPGAILTALVSGGDLLVAYALRYTFVTAVANYTPKTYSFDAWVIVANVANWSGGANGGYMTNTGYPTGVGPTGPAGAGVTTAAADSGLVVTGTTIGINGTLLPTSPVGLAQGQPWNNNNVFCFANGDDT